jgi:branched-chain amino acid transport system substrate-binding protein
MRLRSAVACFTAASCLIPILALAEPCRVTIGLVLPLTSNAASYGERAQRGAMIAQEASRDVCEASLKFGDSKFESATGLSAYRSLVQSSNIDAVITASSQVSIPVRDLAARDGVLQMAIFTSSNAFSKPSGSSFRICSRSSEEVAPLVDIVAQTLKAVAGALFLANDFGESVASDFKI